MIEQLIASGRHREALTRAGALPESLQKHLLASKALDGLGDAAGAVREAEAALAISPAAEAAHVQLGQIFLGNNTPSAALEVFTDALALHPASVLLRAGRGLALKDLVLYDEAEQEFRRCLEGRPGFSVCFDGLATVYLHTKKFADVKALAAEHRRLNPSDFRGPYFLAVGRNGLEEECESLLDESIAMQPRFAASRALRGRLRLQRGDTQGAIEDLEEARRLRPLYATALLSLAHAYKRGNRDADAARAFEELRHANESERRGKPSLIYRRGARK